MYLTSQRRCFMISQRYEFLRRFKYKRMEFDNALFSKKMVQTTETTLNLKEKMIKYFHGKQTKNVSQIMGVYHDSKGITFDLSFAAKNPSFKAMKKKLKKIDRDFQNCISTNILSEKQLKRMRKKHIKRELPKDLPSEAAIDIVENGIKKLKKMKSVNEILQSFENSGIHTPKTFKKRKELGNMKSLVRLIGDKRKSGGRRRKSSGGSTRVDYKSMMITAPKHVIGYDTIVRLKANPAKKDIFESDGEKKKRRSASQIQIQNLSLFPSATKGKKRGVINSQSIGNLKLMRKRARNRSINIFG